MNTAISFAHLSDTHVRPDSIGRSQVYMDHMAEIRASGCDFVIHTGDLMDEPSAWNARAFRAMTSHLPMPTYVVPGNHDVYNPHLGEIEAPWWAKLAVDSQTEARYERWFGPSRYSFSRDGVQVIAIDSLIINSGLPEEGEQWTWLEDSLAEAASHRPDCLMLFTHMPLFIRHPYESPSPTNFRDRYFVVAPPGRDRLLRLIRRHRVRAVFSGHTHVPWQVSHRWPEGFSTQFVTTGTSGLMSRMATEHFGLGVSPAQGLGYHQHHVHGTDCLSHFQQHSPSPLAGKWSLGQTWTGSFPTNRAPSTEGGRQWNELEYRPSSQFWQQPDVGSPLPLDCRPGMTYYVRQMFVAQTETAPIHLQLLTEQGVEIYLNGAHVYTIEPLQCRPPVWTSAGGKYTVDSPILSLPLNQRLVHRGENLLATRVDGGTRPLEQGHIAYLELEATDQMRWIAAEAQQEKDP